MRLKSFTAPSMKEAIGMVRAELGPDAVIVSTVQSRSGGGSVRITAAVEPAEAQSPPPRVPAAQSARRERITEAVRCALEDHGTPDPITARLVAAAKVLKGEELRLALAAALDDCFRFAPIPEQDFANPFMLVGPPGVGKTITTAKLAARARLKDAPVTVFSADTERAGGVEQIANLTRIMRADFRAVADPREMMTAVGECRLGELVLIDSAGTNPFSDTEMGALGDLIAAAKAEPILVLNAGGDAVEYGEIASAFAAIGATRLIVTRVDMARRMGSILAAADAGRLRFGNVSTTPNVGKGLSALNPVSLARLLLPEPVPAAAAQESVA